MLRRSSTALALAVATLLPIGGPLAGQAADTAQRSAGPLFTGRDALVIGAFGAATTAAAPADLDLAERLQRPGAQNNRFLSRTAMAVTYVVEPGAVIIGTTLYGVGRLAGNERMADLGLHGTEAIVVGLGATVLLKAIVGRARPYVDADTTAPGLQPDPRSFRFGRGLKREEYRSFPSGHSTTAFAAAAAVVSEVSRWSPESVWYVAPIMYGGATLAGLSRMYDNKHWGSDVIVGAAIGVFAGRKVVRYHHHSHPGNRLDRWLLSGSLRRDGRGGTALRVLILPY
jgi:membrane-associated phospholipid phosphatase